MLQLASGVARAYNWHQAWPGREQAMSKKVEIRTPRLRLLAFDDRHLTKEYLGWLNDRDLMRFSEQRRRAHTFESCTAYWHSFQDTCNHFVAIERTQGNPIFIGTATLYVDQHSGVANIGILIGDRSAQCQGLGSEAWIGLMHFAFEKLGMRKVEGGALSVNEPIMRLFHKVGLRSDGRRTRQALWEGKEVDLVFLASFRDEWNTPIPVELDSGSRSS